MPPIDPEDHKEPIDIVGETASQSAAQRQNRDQEFRHIIDEKFVRYFGGRLKQVFMYVTEACQLRCKQCLVKPNLVFHMKQKEIELQQAINLLADFFKLGAKKLSLLGGEPALYGDTNHEQLEALIAAAVDIGYSYIRMDTNGQFEDDLLAHEGMQKLNEVSFSLDGHTSDMHDLLRGPGAFAKCVANIKRAVELGYHVDATTCVHRELIKRDDLEQLALHDHILFMESLGVQRLNFHVLLKHGFPMDTWSGETDISWQEWVQAREEINRNIQSGKYKIEVRLPTHFVPRDEFDQHPEYYGYCAAKLGERVLIHPNGRIRICSGLISSEYAVADYNKTTIRWNNTGTNELLDHKMGESTPCTNQSKGMDTGQQVPLCFSFKPKQTEVVWQDMLGWEEKKEGEE